MTDGNHVPLDRAANVRGVGGYRTNRGLVTVTGLLYRGDALCNLSAADLDRIASLRLRAVVDLRTAGEVLTAGPARLPPGPRLVSLPVSGGDLSTIYDVVTGGDTEQQRAMLGGGRAAEIMVRFYREFVADARQRGQFGAALRMIADGALPLLYQCSSGKDRSGWLTAILLTALGVPRQAVLADYLLSNDYLRRPYAQLRDGLAKAGLLRDPELLRPVMEVSPTYLEAAFDEVDRSFGSFTAFLEVGLGIDAERLWALRDELLTIEELETEPVARALRRIGMTRRLGLATLVTSIALAIAGCTNSQSLSSTPPVTGLPQARLMAFNGCAAALAGLRHAAQASVGPYSMPDPMSGLPINGPVALDGGGDMRAASGAQSSAGGTAPSAPSASSSPAFSGTNDYQAGVDEPDMVKTDGRRIVTVAGGMLRVIDAASRAQTGQLSLRTIGGLQSADPYQPVNLLLSGDHALLLISSAYPFAGEASYASAGPELLLVSLSGQPRVLSSYQITNGALLDARQVGSVARVVINSQPRFAFPPDQSGTVAARTAANRAVIARAGLDAWLPSYSQTAGGKTTTGQVPCGAIVRPASYSGGNLLTVLTFNLASAALGTGDAVTLAADGSTVYGTGSSLYVSADTRWQLRPMAYGEGPVTEQHPVTYVYRFDISKPGAPRFAGGGSVPGYLLNQYSLSEWNGYLRVATTTGTSWAVADGRPAGAQTSSSAVYVLTTREPSMRIVGQVTGLGVSERIYAVRFMGPTGYVVTFRQTDPLYTLDLSDPAHPQVRGALALTGYSAYLYPASATRLIGVGRQADKLGHVGGLQVSLFDVTKAASPTRLATSTLANAYTNAEFDPHAFLYWPASRLVVVPLQINGVPSGATDFAPAQSGALVLRISDTGITKAGFVSQPTGYQSIQRSLVIGQTLWTLSGTGLQASNLSTLKQQAWLPFT